MEIVFRGDTVKSPKNKLSSFYDSFTFPPSFFFPIFLSLFLLFCFAFITSSLIWPFPSLTALVMTYWPNRGQCDKCHDPKERNVNEPVDGGAVDLLVTPWFSSTPPPSFCYNTCPKSIDFSFTTIILPLNPLTISMSPPK